MQEIHQEQNRQDQVPMFRQWKHWYWFVLLMLLLEIILFQLLTARFS
ncbi:MAG: hypothetical protein K2Y12_08275 [Chitinophagaceae bacterium]|nr:hypothetical protein [Chitinophagaceae bacterium]